MIVQLGVLFLLGSVSVTSALPPCVCAKNLAPVCGSDGKTYNNECLLTCAHMVNPDLYTAKAGRCDGNNLGSEECICTMEYRPVCGSDGRLYPNVCTLRCAQRTSAIMVAPASECREKRETVQIAELAPPSCSCPRDYNPVCGTDGETYENACILDCSRAKNADLRIDRVGECAPLYDSCACTREANPVCGTDGHTYNNPCVLKCARASAPGLMLDHFGACDDGPSAADPTTSSACVCTRDMKPVCGTDGNTYHNPCLLNCARENNESLHIAYMGACDNSVQVVEEADNVLCACPRNIRPVCASNGVTFRNECLMTCSGSHLTVAAEGPCEQLLDY